jgi:amidase/aspartyl-tRNA(Asn)/glutamyl-tRNA(Gln) amidotransferase subunit A
VARVFDEAVARLRAMGHDVDEVDPRLDELHEPWLHLVLGLLGDMAPLLSPAELEQLEPGNRRMMERGAALTAEQRERAAAEAEAGTARLLAALEPYDALLTPTLSLPPFPLERLTPDSSEDEIWRAFFSWAEYLHPFNVTGQPAISVPAGFTADGLPVGVQIVGPVNGEAAILPIAAAFERATWPDGPPRPPLED